MTLVHCLGIFLCVSVYRAIGQSAWTEQTSNSMRGQSETEILGSAEGKILSRHRRAVGTAVYFTQEEIDAGVKQHNDYRALQGAANMEFMDWHPELARMAQDYAEGCLYEHSSQTNNGCYNVSYTNVGENLHYNTANVGLVAAVTAWYDEVSYYDFDNRTCAEGQFCGHYTQVVWWNSELIGCGRALCPELLEHTGVTANNAYLTSCNYGARGNYGNYPPFTKGDACSSCAAGLDECKNGMCYKTGVDYQRAAGKMRTNCTPTVATQEMTETTPDPEMGKSTDPVSGKPTQPGKTKPSDPEKGEPSKTVTQNPATVTGQTAASVTGTSIDMATGMTTGQRGGTAHLGEDKTHRVLIVVVCILLLR